MGSRIKGGGRAVLSADSQAAIIDLLMDLEAEDGNQGACDGGDVSAHEQRRRRKRFAKRLVQRHERRRLRDKFNALSVGGDAEEERGGRSRNNDVAQTPGQQPSAASSSPNVRVELVEAIFKSDGKKKKGGEKEGKDKKKSDKGKKSSNGRDFTIGAKKVAVLSQTTTVKELLKSCKSKLKMKKNPARAFVKVGDTSSAMFDLDTDLSGVEDGTTVYVSVTPAPVKDDEEEGNASDEEGDAAGDEEIEDPLESVKRAYRQQELHRQPKQLKRMDEIVDEKKRAAFEVTRAKLPVAAHKQRILDTIEANPVVVLSGATGSGKSTQVPQFLLEGRPLDPKRPYIVVTQPRRVAATSLAQRVAEERGCPPPGAPGSSVGYMVRSDRRVDLRSCQIIYVTIGILLRMLVGRRDEGFSSSDTENGDGEIVPQLSINTISHLIIDETHERDVNTDFSLTLLKGMLASPSTSCMPRLVLMSATASTGLFVSYFSTKGVVPASIEVPGKTFPVDTQWLGDCEKFAGKTLRTRGGSSDRGDMRGDGEKNGGDVGVELSPRAAEAIDNEFVRSLAVAIVKQQQSEGKLEESTNGGECRSTGAILVFLPGLGEIESLARCLFEKGTILSDRGLCKIYKLHSSVPKSDQRVVFQPASRGTVKIVLATNIAETSVTIPDISHVIDTCRVKESRYNASTRIKELVTVWTSLASMKQRAGRAGRTSNGTCWRLCSEEFAKGLLLHTVPEMARTPLDELILQIGLLYEQRRDEYNRRAGEEDGYAKRPFSPGFKPLRFLSMTPTPPAERGLAQACKHLLEVEALKIVDHGPSADEQSFLFRLSPLGYHLSRLPMDAKVGKMLIVGCLLGCLDNALTIAAALSCAKSCFMPNRNLDTTKIEARDSLVENGFGGKDWTGGTVKGDLIAVIAVFRAWRVEKKCDRDKFCRRHALNSTSLREMETMQRQFRDLMVDAGLVSRSEGTNDPDSDDSNIARDDALLTSCCLVGGLYPNVCALIRPTGPKGGGRLLTHDSNASCRPSSNSFQRKRVQNASKSGKDVYAMYLAKHQSIGTATPGQKRPPETFLSEVNFVSTFALLLFGGELELVKNALIVDKWLKFKISSDDDEDKAKQNAVLILSLRELLDEVILEHVVETFAPLEEKAAMVERHKTIVSVIHKVLADEG
ncbi:hypothetical protein ACHAXT_010507 [Thalassiosira profunda]